MPLPDRRKQLEDLLGQQYELLAEYDRKIGFEDDPITLNRYKLTQDGVKKRIQELQEELGVTPQSAASGSATPTTPSSTNPPDKVWSRSELFQLLDKRFSINDLKSLCFNLDEVDYDNLDGNDKSSKARELILYMERRNRLVELGNKIKEVRSDI